MLEFQAQLANCLFVRDIHELRTAGKAQGANENAPILAGAAAEGIGHAELP
jgi:hypothetical protein